MEGPQPCLGDGPPEELGACAYLAHASESTEFVPVEATHSSWLPGRCRLLCRRSFWRVVWVA
jgi:hypothetical protein